MSDGSDLNAEVLRRLARIEQKVTSLDELTGFGMRPDRDRYLGEVDDIIGSSRRKAQLYVGADGLTTVGQLADRLGISVSANASRRLAELEREGLLTVDFDGNQRIYAKKPIDRALRISEHLRRRFNLGADGAANGS